jgi:hypothetical protein
MQIFRGSALAVCATGLLAAAGLLGCASSRLASQPPPGVRLAGDWKLDPARSDDLGKAIVQLHAQQAKARRDTDNEPQRIGDDGSRRRGGGGSEPPEGGEPGEGESPSAPESGPELRAGPMPHASFVDELMSSVPRGDYLRITVSADAFTVTSGDASEQYTPGLESDISAEHGDAKQISGWKGPQFVIDTKPQWGAEIIQSYGLTPDGRLAMSVRLSGRGAHLTFTRLYERTTRVAPLSPPTNN